MSENKDKDDGGGCLFLLGIALCVALVVVTCFICYHFDFGGGQEARAFKEYGEGAAAQKAGLDPSNNPYTGWNDSGNAARWLKGWCDSKNRGASE